MPEPTNRNEKLHSGLWNNRKGHSLGRNNISSVSHHVLFSYNKKLDYLPLLAFAWENSAQNIKLTIEWIVLIERNWSSWFTLQTENQID